MCRRILVSGRVQGVGYRAFARRRATELGISGHALNLADGRVEVLACGAADALGSFAEALREGPAWSEVHALESEAAPCCPDGFRTG